MMSSDETPKDLEIIPAGAYLFMSTGEYSDYRVCAHFRAKVALDTRALQKEFLDAHPDKAEDYHFDEDEFLSWLSKKDILEELDTFEWHTDNYGCASQMEVFQPRPHRA